MLAQPTVSSTHLVEVETSRLFLGVPRPLGCTSLDDNYTLAMSRCSAEWALQELLLCVVAHLWETWCWAELVMVGHSLALGVLAIEMSHFCQLETGQRETHMDRRVRPSPGEHWLIPGEH